MSAAVAVGFAPTDLPAKDVKPGDDVVVRNAGELTEALARAQHVPRADRPR